MTDSVDHTFLLQAINLSKNAPDVPTCFRVGAVLVDADRRVISHGFTLELGDGWHAEAVAIEKAKKASWELKGATIYSSIEPCSVRASGRKDCASLLIEFGIARVVFALKEPSIFVKGEGVVKLRSARIVVEQLSGYEDSVRQINRHVLGQCAAEHDGVHRPG